MDAFCSPNVLPRVRVSLSPPVSAPPDERNEVTSSLPYYPKPLKWDHNIKKWLANDVVTVKSSFKMPYEDQNVVSNMI